MKVLGKVADIVLLREGTSAMSGNSYQIQTVVIEAANTSDRIVVSVFGSREHLEKYGIKVGAEGAFTYSARAEMYQGRYFQRCDLDARAGFEPQGGGAELRATQGAQQLDVMAAAAKAAEQAMPMPPVAGQTEKPAFF